MKSNIKTVLGVLFIFFFFGFVYYAMNFTIRKEEQTREMLFFIETCNKLNKDVVIHSEFNKECLNKS